RKTYQDWGGILTARLGVLATTAQERRLILEQARKSYETALTLTRFGGQRALVEREFGACLLATAESSDDVAENRALYRQAATRFESVTTLKSDLATASVHRMWGLCFGQLAKLEKDDALFRQAAA